MARVLGLVGAVCVGLLTLLLIENPFTHRLVVKAYFSDGMDLRAGAQVRLAGVDIGHVKTVRVRPELKETPVEVTMILAPAYEIKIPNDSVATLSTADVFGQTYVAVNIANAVGPPIESGAVLKSGSIGPIKYWRTAQEN